MSRHVLPSAKESIKVVGFATRLRSIALSGDGKLLFVAAPPTGSVQVFERESSGAAVQRVDRIPFPESGLVAVSPDRRHVYVVGGSSIALFRDSELDP